jgi:hypothetical protein
MQLNSKVYDALKWVTLIALPAVGTAYVGLAQIWNLPFASQISQTTVVLVLLLGALLGVSSANFNKAAAVAANATSAATRVDGIMHVDSSDPKKDVFSFELFEAPEDFPERDTLTFKVSKTSP